LTFPIKQEHILFADKFRNLHEKQEHVWVYLTLSDTFSYTAAISEEGSNFPKPMCANILSYAQMVQELSIINKVPLNTFSLFENIIQQIFISLQVIHVSLAKIT
jgi:hypothetical protein